MQRLSASIRILAVAGALCMARCQSSAANSSPPIPKAFLENFCFDCHDEDLQKGGLNLQGLAFDSMDAHSLRRWTAVFDRVLAQEMPPREKLQPSSKHRDRFVESVRIALTEAWAEHYRTQGRVKGRRLNPTEYENTVRDLLSAPWLELADMLPADPEKYGFDNVAEAQEISYVQLARYLEAAEVAIDGAMRLRPQPEPSTYRTWFSERGRYLGKGEFQGQGTGRNRPVGKWLVLLRQPNSAQAPFRIEKKSAPHQAPGWYRFRVKCRAVHYDNGALKAPRRGQVASINTAAKRVLGRFNVPEGPDGAVVEFIAWQHQDELLEFFCDTLDDRNFDRKKPQSPYQGDGIAVEWFEIEGPFPDEKCKEGLEPDAWPPESYRRLFGDLKMTPWTKDSGLHQPEMLHLPDWTANKRGLREAFQNPAGMMMVVSEEPDQDAERLLRRFMKQAFRRSPEESEIQRCLGFATAAIDRKVCFQDAMRLAYKSVLCSPDFLYFQEPLGKLDGPALASRLSYFLWRTLPDAPLLEAATDGKLSTTTGLMEEMNRLLNDPRSQRFVSDFTGQWLDLRTIHDTSPDRFLFPEYFCDVHLVNSAIAETEASFAEMLRRDLPALTVVQSDFVMINERLAELYGIEGVRGLSIRPVNLPAHSPRGGFLTQSSVLKVTANGLTTSPVKRGAWALDRILGTPPSSPPPDAGAIEPDTRGATTIRQLLAKHSRNESCSTCHNAIDPPGFALESFDVMGAWQDRYRSFEQGEEVHRKIANRNVRYKLAQFVDASGQTEDGFKFENFHEFRRHLVTQEEQIARNLTERLVIFATGAGVSFADRGLVEEILQQTKPKQYGLRSLVEAVVLSRAFRTK